MLHYAAHVSQIVMMYASHTVQMCTPRIPKSERKCVRLAYCAEQAHWKRDIAVRYEAQSLFNRFKIFPTACAIEIKLHVVIVKFEVISLSLYVTYNNGI